MTDLLTTRALNRATLARQWLLERSARPAVEAIEHLVGLQAQAPFPPYYGLWSRLDGFYAEELSNLLQERRVVRIVLMRGTVHLVSARDALTLRPLVQPIMERDLQVNSTYAAGLAGLDLDALAEIGRQLVETRPLTLQELRPLLAEHYPGRDAASLAYAIRNLLPLVQTPPRGVWGRSGLPRLTTAQHWLGQPLDPNPSLEAMILRYLAAFGPATVNDVQTWCGLTRLREVMESLRPRLVTFVDERGVELFDLPDAPRPPADTPAPVRLLAEFDNVLLSHADRTRIMSDAARRRLFSSKNGVFPGTLLVDGFVVGFWSITRQRHSAVLTLKPFEPLPSHTVGELEAEAERLLGLAAGDADTHEVRMMVED